MLDLDAMRKLIDRMDFCPRFVTVSGAHLYGFPSPDSDVDLRGCHQLLLADVVGLDPPRETMEKMFDEEGTEIDLVSHDVGKYLRLLVRNNGYILEQIFSPLVVCGQDFLEELRPLARRCITKFHYHHYRGFFATQKKLMEKQQPPTVKSMLYGYRVLLTGIHLLQTGEVEASLLPLLERFNLNFLQALVEQKQTERASLTVDWEFHRRQFEQLEGRLDQAYADSTLPEDRDRAAVNDLLVRLRLGNGD